MATPAQVTMGEGLAPSPIAKVLGQPYHELPQDLFIPPDALEVFLDTFEGPLDLALSHSAPAAGYLNCQSCRHRPVHGVR